MANILILGAGSMGTAFSFPCSDNNHVVSIIGTHLENDFVNQINSKNKHPLLNCDVSKNVKFLKFGKLEEEINKKVDLIVVAVISKGIEWASTELSKVMKDNIPILILTKGLAINNNNYEVLAHKMDRLMKKNGIKKTCVLCALCGELNVRFPEVSPGSYKGLLLFHPESGFPGPAPKLQANLAPCQRANRCRRLLGRCPRCQSTCAGPPRCG